MPKCLQTRYGDLKKESKHTKTHPYIFIKLWLHSDMRKGVEMDGALYNDLHCFVILWLIHINEDCCHSQFILSEEIMAKAIWFKIRSLTSCTYIYAF